MSASLELFIYVDEEGNPVGNPLLLDNLLSAIPDFDTNNLPSNMEKFVRVPYPVDNWIVVEGTEPSYQRVGGVLTDVWDVRPMTDIEKTNSKELLKAMFIELIPFKENFLDWIVDDEKVFTAPIPCPDYTLKYEWRGSTGSWEIRNTKPTSGGPYEWNPILWEWVEKQN